VHRGKFLIVSNYLRSHLGHFFETSISLAEAARRAGWQPVLATHHNCCVELLPNWLESHRLFFSDCVTECRPTADPYGVYSPGRLRRTCGKTWQLCSAAASTAERAAYYLLPPLIYDTGRWLGYCLLPRCAHPAYHANVRRAFDKLQRRRGEIPGDDVLSLAQPWPEISLRLTDPRQRPRIVEAVRELVPLGFGLDLEETLCFQRDLLRFLALTNAGPGDQVLIGTAHPRDVLAVLLAIDRFGRHRAPSFHLEFLYSLFEGDPAAEASTPSTNVRLKRLLFSLYNRWGGSDRVKFYCDSETLARDYEMLSGQRFGVLPIPFRAELLSPVPRAPSGPLRPGYFGEARDEKGFHWLPDLAEALRDDYLAPGSARLLIQANIQPQYNPQSIKALERLKQFSPAEVQLFAAETALSPVEYYRMMSQSDIVLLPYIHSRYRACTSGVFAEALAMGAPPVVPAGTWMADQLPPGGGETFGDFDSFVAGVKRLLDNFDGHRRTAQDFRPIWRERHSPDALIAALLGGEPVAGQLPSRAAA
jgi:hypothetical protein